MEHKDQKHNGETKMDDKSTSAPLPQPVNSVRTNDDDPSDTKKVDVQKPAPQKTPDAPKDSATTSAHHSVSSTIAGTTWVGLIIGAVILILLLVFILQNGDTVQLKMFVWTWDFPIGVGMLIASVAGALIAACVGTVRIFQLRRQVKMGQ